MSADSRPCGGDVYHEGHYPMALSTDSSIRFCENCTLSWRFLGKCLGREGWEWLALVAVDVAAERAETIERLLHLRDTSTILRTLVKP